MILLTNEQQESYEKAKISYICKKVLRWIPQDANDKKYCTARDQCHYASK